VSTTVIRRVRTLEYSGAPFGRPDPAFMSQAWRLRTTRRAARLIGRGTPLRDSAGYTLLYGQDAVTVPDLTPGFPVYAGYRYGTYDNWAELTARFGGKAQLVSITPVVQSQTKCRVLDVEPGDAAPGDCPLFQAEGNQAGGLPVYYTSAGDSQAVIDALLAAGYKRSDFFLWSAHWIGPHVCGPSVCGFPQADATQYASNSRFDSDVFRSYVLAPATPWPLREGDSGPNVVILQQNLNKWAAQIGLNPALRLDGTFGPATKAAVVLALTAWWYNSKRTAAAVVDESLWNHLAGNEPPPATKGAPLSAGQGKAVVYKITVDRAIAGYTGAYTTRIQALSGSWLAMLPPHGGLVTAVVPGPGTYTVTTGAVGWKQSSMSVTVEP
jgi:peptidoglycan hydrolase-like protein with peptidoglycan-binding domain